MNYAGGTYLSSMEMEHLAHAGPGGLGGGLGGPANSPNANPNANMNRKIGRPRKSDGDQTGAYERWEDNSLRVLIEFLEVNGFYARWRAASKDGQVRAPPGALFSKKDLAAEAADYLSSQGHPKDPIQVKTKVRLLEKKHLETVRSLELQFAGSSLEERLARPGALQFAERECPHFSWLNRIFSADHNANLIAYVHANGGTGAAAGSGGGQYSSGRLYPTNDNDLLDINANEPPPQPPKRPAPTGGLGGAPTPGGLGGLGNASASNPGPGGSGTPGGGPGAGNTPRTPFDGQGTVAKRPRLGPPANSGFSGSPGGAGPSPGGRPGGPGFGGSGKPNLAIRGRQPLLMPGNPGIPLPSDSRWAGFLMQQINEENQLKRESLQLEQRQLAVKEIEAETKRIEASNQTLMLQLELAKINAGIHPGSASAGNGPAGAGAGSGSGAAGAVTGGPSSAGAGSKVGGPAGNDDGAGNGGPGGEGGAGTGNDRGTDESATSRVSVSEFF
ncbi:hypothetical protein HDU96_000742 [Phlyctochytrium bullatum]|nr:hypothetical protein HDU96_000742 [Phlyctochytrium bullatum]